MSTTVRKVDLPPGSCAFDSVKKAMIMIAEVEANELKQITDMLIQAPPTFSDEDIKNVFKGSTKRFSSLNA